MGLVVASIITEMLFPLLWRGLGGGSQHPRESLPIYSEIAAGGKEKRNSHSTHPSKPSVQVSTGGDERGNL